MSIDPEAAEIATDLAQLVVEPLTAMASEALDVATKLARTDLTGDQRIELNQRQGRLVELTAVAALPVVVALPPMGEMA